MDDDASILTSDERAEARAILLALAARWRAQPWFFVLTETAPGPVAHEIRAFAEVLEAGEAGGALLQLRDTVETLIKFLVLTIARDLIVHGTPEDADKARRTLFERTLQLSQWRGALRGLGGIARRGSPFLTAGLASLALRPSVQDPLGRFIEDRNDRIAHGAFCRDPREAAGVVEDVAFAPNGGGAAIFAAFGNAVWPRIVLEHPGGEETLTGADSVRRWHDHPHHTGEALPDRLPIRAEFADGTLELAPFIAGRVCDWGTCGHQDVFLFDNRRRTDERSSFDFLDVVQGHKFLRPDAELETVATGVPFTPPKASEIEQGPLGQKGLESLEAAAADTRYVSPTYLRTIVADAIEGGESSLTWIQAPGHIGKTIFARAIADPRAEAADPLPFDDLAVVGLFIKREWRADLSFLRTRLTDTLMARLGINPDRRDQFPILEATAPDKSAAFVALLAKALSENCKPGVERLLVVIDGLDELAPTEAGHVFADFLPTAARVPKGVHLLLTSRRVGDTDAPGWLGARLQPRLGTDCVRRIDLEDAGYVAVMRQYPRDVLGRDLGDAVFDQLLEKSQGLFLYFAFLVDQIHLKRLAPADLIGLPTGPALFKRFLSEFKREMGWKRLAEEAELLLLALAAEELAHDWAAGPGRVADHAGPVITVGEWRGVDLDTLADVLDRRRADGAPEGILLYAVVRLKAAIGVHRGEGGDARFRLWLKGLVEAMADDAAWSAGLRQLHARAATRGADAARDALALPENERAPRLRAWSSRMPRLLGHAVLAGSEPVLHRVRDEDEVLDAAIAWSAAAQDHATGFADAQGASNTAITLLRRRMASLPDAATGVTELDALAGALMNRGNARQRAGDPTGAIADYDAAIALREALRDTLGNEQPILWRNELANAYMNLGVAKMSAPGFGPGAAIADYDAAITLQETPRHTLGDGWPVPWRNDLAAAYMNRGTAKQDAPGFGPGAAIADYDAAITLREALRDNLKDGWPVPWRNALANAYMNRGVAKRSAPGFGPGAAIADYDAAITLMQTLRDTLGDGWPVPWRNDLANAYMNRGVAKQSAPGFGPGAAIADYDAAITLMQTLRDTLGDGWPVPWRNDLANAYMNRGNARQSAPGFGPGAAIADYDAAITLMQALRDTLDDGWPVPWRNDLAIACFNRGLVSASMGDLAGAAADARAAKRLAQALLAEHGAAASPLWTQVAQAAAELEARIGNAATPTSRRWRLWPFGRQTRR